MRTRSTLMIAAAVVMMMPVVVGLALEATKPPLPRPPADISVRTLPLPTATIHVPPQKENLRDEVDELKARVDALELKD